MRDVNAVAFTRGIARVVVDSFEGSFAGVGVVVHFRYMSFLISKIIERGSAPRPQRERDDAYA